MIYVIGGGAFMRRALLAIGILIVVAACGGGGGSVGSGTPRHPVIAAPETTNATLRIVVPSAPSGSAAKRPAFISSNTQSISVAVQSVNSATPSPLPAPVVVALTPSNPNCTTTSNGTSCTVTITVPIATSVVLAISSYASTDGSGTPLATGFTTAVNTQQSGASFAVTLGGVPATIVMSPLQLQANDDGSVHTTTITVSALDASGATIIAPGAYSTPISLSVSGDPNGALGLSPAAVSSPVSGGTTVTVTYTSSKALAAAATINATAGSASSHVTFTPLGSVGGVLTAGYRIFETNVPTANAAPYGITSGPNGAVWFSENATSKLGALFPSTCETTPPTMPPSSTTPTPLPSQPPCTIIDGALPEAIGPTGLAAATDGNIWVGGQTPAVNFHVYTLEPTASCASSTSANLSACTIVAQQPDPMSSPVVTDIAAGNDGLMHATMYSTSEANVEAYFPATLPAAQYDGGYNFGSGGQPFAVSTTQWFTDPALDEIGLSVCFEGCTSGQIYNFIGGGVPQGIVAGPDGNLYVADAGNNAIVGFSPGSCAGSSCAYTSYTIPTPSSSPEFLTVGPDGNIWFTEFSGNKIGILVLSSHQIIELSVPTTSSGPWGIALGPDGHVWFTERTANKIGVVIP